MKNHLAIGLVISVMFVACNENTIGYQPPPPFDLPQYDSLADTLDLFPVKVMNRYGYINKKGQMVIEPQYEKAYDFEEGLAVVRLNAGISAYMNKTGKIIWKENEGTRYSKGMGDFVK